MKDKDLQNMSRSDLEDEVMLLRAQVKVLQNWLARDKVTVATDWNERN